MNKYQCSNAQHKIVSVCLNKECTQERVCCQKCELEYHNDHSVGYYYIKVQSLNLPQCQLFRNKGWNQVTNYIKVLIKSGKLLDYLDWNLIDQYHNLRIEQKNIQEQQNYFQNHLIGAVLELEFRLRYHKNSNFESFNQIVQNIENNIRAIGQNLDVPNHQSLEFLQFPKRLNHQAIHEVNISKDGTIIASGSSDGIVKLWATRNQELQQTLQNNDMVQHLVISSNNVYLVIVGENSIRIYNIKQRKYYWSTINHISKLKKISLSQDCKFLLSVGKDNQLKFWSVDKRKVIFCLRDITHIIKSIVISPDNQLISWICKSSGDISFWSFKQKEYILHKKCAHKCGISLCSSNDSSIFISGGGYQIKIWALINSNNTNPTLNIIKIIQLTLGNSPIRSIILTSDNKFIISINYDAYIMIHQRESGQMIQVILQREPYCPKFIRNRFTHSPLSISGDMYTMITCLISGINMWTREAKTNKE